MRQHLFAVRIIVLAGLAFGWLVGLVAQWTIVEETSYLDVSPALLALGLTLCLLAGAAARIGAPDRHQVRIGALAGVGMVLSIVAGYVALAVAYRDRFSPDAGGETWWTLVLESWFWVGMPLVVSAVLGAIGWVIADRLQRVGGRSSA